VIVHFHNSGGGILVVSVVEEGVFTLHNNLTHNSEFLEGLAQIVSSHVA